MEDVRTAMNELEQEVTAENGGVNPIRELSDLRREFQGLAQDAGADLHDATTFPTIHPVDEPAPGAEPAAVSSTTSSTTETARLLAEEQVDQAAEPSGQAGQAGQAEHTPQERGA
jgi:division protein CdvB (Snf7/Vps24/ESCRT-III family)